MHYIDKTKLLPFVLQVYSSRLGEVQTEQNQIEVLGQSVIVLKTESHIFLGTHGYSLA